MEALVRVLVSTASRYGSTREIGTAIGEHMRAGGHEVDLVDAADVAHIGSYDAVVAGGAVYAGHWVRGGA
jgi:menaquinone-dependent protoporphyrinogen oxidase